MTRRRPPRLADWLLRRTLPRGPRGDTIRGDLVEALRAHPGSRRAAARTYWRHTISLAVRYGWRRGPAGAERRTPMLLDSLRQDIRFAARSYAKTPAFTAIILATLALGIGASTAIFSMINGIVLKPLPFPEPDRLVFVNERNSGGTMSVSWPNYLDWRARARSFDGLASSRNELLSLTAVDRPQRLEGRRVTGNFLRVLGVPPAIGRDFSDADDRPGSEPVVMLSDALWRTQFRGSASAVGSFLTLDGRPHRVIGVLPPGFRYGRPYDLLVSMGPHADLVYARQRADHAGHFVVGRLKAGVDIREAAAELRGIGLDLQREYPATNVEVVPAVEPLASRFVADVRTTLIVLMGAVGCLLLIACVNVANLLVARGAARQHELAVRAALGGGRTRLTAQLLVESALVSIAGGALGLLAASWLLHLLIAVAPKATPRLDEVHLDGRAMLFALAATTLCGLVFGAFPALQASRATGQAAVIRTRPTGAAAPSHRLRRGLIVIEVAVALVLLAGAGLTMQTVTQLMRVDTGFRPDHVLTLRVPLTGPQWPAERRRVFFETVRSSLAALPGVEAAGLVSRLPIDGSDWNTLFIARDKPVPARTNLPGAAMTMPSAGYFEAIGTRVVRGRAFTTADTNASAPVAVVNETLARLIWPGEDAIGKQIKWGFPESTNAWREVVGIVADVKYEGVAEPTPMQIYMPITQETPRDLAVVVRASGSPSAVRAATERVIHAFDANIPVYSVRTLDEMLATSMARERMSMLVFGVFGLVALVLASVGLYGVVAHGVTERTHEIGIRLALGADRKTVLALVVGQGLSMSLAGTIVGLAASVGLSRSLQGLLFGVTPTDPATFMTVVAILLAVALIACSVPAWRAARLDPSTALRTE